VPREGDAAVKATVHFDGGGQYPAQTVAAATVRYDDGSVVDVARTFKPGEGTNNTAEYQALILGLTTAYESGVTEVRVFGDSMVVVEGRSSLLCTARRSGRLASVASPARPIKPSHIASLTRTSFRPTSCF
jgi:ribonuclease HI